MTLLTPSTKDSAVESGAAGVDRGRSPWWHLLVLAAVAWIPFLYTHPGYIAADTKAYLYLDPATLVRSARYMWNPNVAMGTVTHQNIGYLFPMGPWYWLLHVLHVPTWIAQRLWMGTLLFAAGTGVRYLARLLGIGPWGQLAAALPYMLSPFIVDYIARTSAILMPWAGLGWMLGFTVLAVRRGGWRYPALFALVVALVGGINATSILLVGLAPIVWLVMAGCRREASWGRIGTVALKTGFLSLVVSLWWIAGLWAEGAFGIDVLRYTETFPTVTSTSLSSEVLRGLGYWYFYGNDAIQPWTQESSVYMFHSLAVLLSFAIPAIGLLSAAFIRWRYRAFAVVVSIIGVVAAVGAYPLTSPSPLGRAIEAAGENSTIGLAMRSSNRVIPLVVLGLSLLTGAAVSALASWRQWAPVLAAVLVGVLACLNLSPFFEGKIVATNLMFPEALPGYVTSAADYLNSAGTTPVLGIPGLGFGYYRWGVTMDSVWPGLLTRPYISRQAVVQGEPASANLLRALDESIQDGIFTPSTLAPMARLMGAGDVLLQSDEQYERFGGPRPQTLWLQLQPTPAGLTLVKGFGPDTPQGTEVGPIIDESQLAIPPGASYPQALYVYAVANPRALLRTESIDTPIVLAGDGEGILLASSFGLLDGSPRAIVYSASRTPAQIAGLAARHGSLLVLTDTNAKRLDSWGTLQTTYGYVEQAGEQPLVSNPAEQPLAIFENQSPSTQTVLQVQGIRSVQASGYGNAVANAPEDQPLNAVDGNPLTAWTVGAFSDPRGQYLKVQFLKPTRVSQVTLLQPQTGPRNRAITHATLTFSNGTEVPVALGPSSLSTGQTVRFPARLSSSLTVTITDMTGSKTDLSGYSGVGFAEVSVPGVGPVTSTLRMPTDLLAGAGTAGDLDPLDILMHRLRAATIPPRTDPELAMSRTFTLPSARTFSVSGTSAISTLISDSQLDALLGRGQGSGLRIVSTSSSSRLAGDLNAGSWSAFDADPASSWISAFTAPDPPWLSATLSSATTISSATLQVLNDQRHSVPTSVTVSTERGQHVTVPIVVPPAPAGATQGALSTVHLSFAPLTGTTFRFTFPTLASELTTDHISGRPTQLPVGIATIALPGVPPATTPATFTSGCLRGLVDVDARPVPVSVSGSTAAALDQDEMTVAPCGAPVTLRSGTHVVTTAPGYSTGFNINTLELSAPGAPSSPASPATPVQPTAVVSNVRWINPVSLSATVGAQKTPSWLVLNQSFNSGWRATLDGHDLGSPSLIDGGFTAWRLPATTGAAALTIDWAPQHTVDIALIASALGMLAVLVILAFTVSRRRRVRTHGPDLDDVPLLSLPWTSPGAPALLLAGGAVLVGMVISGPAVALVTVPLLALAVWRPRLRAVLVLAPVVLLAITGLYMVEAQGRHSWTHDIQWPSHFGVANTLAWVALCALLVDVAAYGDGGTPRTGAPPAAAPGPGDDAPAPPPADTPPAERTIRLAPGGFAAISYALSRRGRAARTEAAEAGDEVIWLPTDGVARSLALLEAFRHEQDDPERFYRTLALDTAHRLTGATPLFNRTLVDIGGGPGYFADAFREAGARVVLVEPEAADPLPDRLAQPDDALSAAERHERTVWPGRLLPRETIAGDGMALPLADGSADVVFSSNVLEHVVDPARFIDEAVRITAGGGLIYLSFTAWYSPWGGHETSPWHLVSGSYALRRYTRDHGAPPKNVFGESLFALNVGTVLRLVNHRADVRVVSAEPRYYPRWARFIVHVPVIRELATWNLVVMLEKL